MSVPYPSCLFLLLCTISSSLSLNNLPPVVLSASISAASSSPLPFPSLPISLFPLASSPPLDLFPSTPSISSLSLTNRFPNISVTPTPSPALSYRSPIPLSSRSAFRNSRRAVRRTPLSSRSGPDRSSLSPRTAVTSIPPVSEQSRLPFVESTKVSAGHETVAVTGVGRSTSDSGVVNHYRDSAGSSVFWCRDTAVKRWLVGQMEVAVMNCAMLLDRIVQHEVHMPQNRMKHIERKSLDKDSRDSIVSWPHVPSLQPFCAALRFKRHLQQTDAEGHPRGPGDSTQEKETLRGKRKCKMKWGVCVSSDETPSKCLILMETPEGRKAMGPKGQKDRWVSVEALNSLRRRHPLKVTDLWYGEYQVDFDVLAPLLSTKTLLLGLILDHAVCLPLILAAACLAISPTVCRVAWSQALRVLTGRFFWRSYHGWSRLLYAPLPLKLLLGRYSS
eukprot:GHVQ01033183.1.p1 GENE.GHVQ01033183.1~~GHVQ01033183.1.p1  ORF type:complete len:446 (-),score=53.52 GHVQ01033183.1:998-2335(-)